MAEEREKISAAVILIIFLIGAIVVYLITLPQPVAYSLVFGNFSTASNSTPSSNVAPANSFYYPITSYLGGDSTSTNSTYSLGTFAASYNSYNSTISSASPFKLSSSLFGSSSYNIGFNGTPSDPYFISLNITSVGGTPNLKISLNGNYFYTAIPAGNENIIIKMPQAEKGHNVVSIYNDLNGFAFSQSISFSNVSITQMYSNNASHFATVTPLTFSGLGNYVLQFTPIGYGNLTVSINGYQISQMSSASDVPISIPVPSNVVNQAINGGTSPILPVSFDVGFAVGKKSTYEIANAGILYTTPVITQNSMTIPYSVKETNGEYIMTFDVGSIIEQGSVNFDIYPSGQTFQIPSANLVTGENILIIPKAALSGQASNGNFTGTIAMSSTGLVIPNYLDIKPTS